MAVKNKKYTVKDVYREANTLLQTEMSGLKNRPLNKTEEIKMKELGRLISNMVLKEMKVL